MKRTSKALAVVAGIAILADLGQAWTIASLLPLTKVVPVYLWVRPDGTVDSSVALSRLPATQSEAVVTAALWEYVRLREGYSYDTAQYGYDAVFLIAGLLAVGRQHPRAEIGKPRAACHGHELADPLVDHDIAVQAQQRRPGQVDLHDPPLPVPQEICHRGKIEQLAVSP